MEQSNINPMVRCGEYITADEGVIYSPGYPNLYEVNLICMWRLTVNVGKSIKLNLRYLGTDHYQISFFIKKTKISKKASTAPTTR
jgi:hypothetical protein